MNNGPAIWSPLRSHAVLTVIEFVTKTLVFRVPYPIGYFTKWMDGRVDDPNGGWKGKSLWSTYATRTMFPEFTYTGATYDVDASLARGWVDELVDANALSQRARNAAQEMARLSPRAFAQAKKQLRQEAFERLECGGVTTDQTVTDSGPRRSAISATTLRAH